ncbi:CAX-interacting protein 4 [Morella rubra]|uniref:CAX-interacting protein 4 n=1 Tax=Morella rubra TaxID=262757 RepID=A0A6A1V6V0_9ROSI|nr:CAX-interacting protein 4 [Morella rubra]KAB1208135.1 CAX-interacting protein 4 [Morella rubra]
MPATAGRVRMPANNRVHSSAALQTHGIWQSAIGYDPYAPNKDDARDSANHTSANAEPDAENAYASFQGLLALARITGSNANEARGACKKCGRVGHLTFQCRNFLSVKEEIKDKDPDAIEAAALAELDKLKGHVGKVKGKTAGESSDESDEEDDSESSGSDVDSDIERIIAARNGKKISSKGRSLKKELDEDESDTDTEERKKRGRSKKRSGKRAIGDSDDSDGGRKKRKKERRSNTDKSSDDDHKHRRHHRKSMKEKRRRRSHRYSDSSDSDASEDNGREFKRKSRKGALTSGSHGSGSDDPWVGRGKKRHENSGRKRRHEEYA